MTVFDPLEAAPPEAAEQPERRRLSERQAEVMERLVAAAAEEAEARTYADISVRTIAKRAGVAPATAYTYFSGTSWPRCSGGAPSPPRPSST
jgi:hypothetical protein